MKIKPVKLASCGILMVLLSACQSTPAPTFSSPPPVATPVTNPLVAPVRQTATTGKTTISADGTTVITEQTTTTIGFDPGKAAQAISAAASPSATPNIGLTGQWTMVSSSSGATCNLAFYGAPNATSGQAASNCPPGFLLNGINGWGYQNGQLSIIKGAQTVLTLNQLGPARFDGIASNGLLSTTITLKR